MALVHQTRERRKSTPLTSQQSQDVLLTIVDADQDHDFIKDMSCKTRIAYESESLWWGTIILLLVIIDFIVFLFELADYGDDIQGVLVTTQVSLAIAVLLSIEWLVRLFAVGPSNFLCRKVMSILPWIDFVASFGGLVLVSYSLNVILVEQRRKVATRYLSAITLARLVRVFRVCFIIGSQKYNVRMAVSRLVSQNRRRFQDDEFDLDLTYVTDRIIAMSLPAHKMTDRTYRNNINDVERFFQTRHANHYRIYNVTSERRYEEKRFEGNVALVDIDDHNPCPLLELKSVCNSIETFLNENDANVVAVHCKGGKGRTGTAICCYLLHSQNIHNADASLAYFAHRRTDESRGDTYQGVQTPSQARYISYYDRMINDEMIQQDINAPPGYILESVTMKNIGVEGNQKNPTFELIVYDGTMAVRLKKKPKKSKKSKKPKHNTNNKKSNTQANDVNNVNNKEEKNEVDETSDEDGGSGGGGLGKVEPCISIGTVKGKKNIPSTDDSSNGVYTFDFGPKGIFVRGDVKCRMLSSWLLPGKKYDSSFMYFWFHTAFLKTKMFLNSRDRSTSSTASIARKISRKSLININNENMIRSDPTNKHKIVLHLGRNELDNGHHSKNQKVLPIEFCIDLTFRLATMEETENAGPYTPKIFNDVTVGGGGGNGNGKIQSSTGSSTGNDPSFNPDMVDTTESKKGDTAIEVVVEHPILNDGDGNKNVDKDDEDDDRPSILDAVSPWSK